MAHDLEFKNILVIHFGQLGDVVLGLPALRAIRSHFPAAKITTLSGSSTVEIIRLGDVSNDQIAVDRVKLRDGKKLESIFEIIRLVKDVRSRKFDLVVDINSLYETNLLGFLSGARHRLYANRENRSLDWLANFPVKPPVEDKSMHHTDRYLAVLESMGLRGLERVATITPPAESVEAARLFLATHQIKDRSLIGIFLGAGHPTRRWDIDKFVEVARRLSQNPRNQTLIFLGPEEREIRGGLGEKFGDAALVVDEMSLSDLAGMLSCLKVLVAGDTGPMHLGAGVGAGIVLLSEKGSPSIFRPLVTRLRVLDDRPLADITVDQVEAAALELLK